jgi:hypothetical protein
VRTRIIDSKETHMNKRSIFGVSTLLAAAAAAHAQFINDGNLNSLPVGTAPDCATPAGAWQFPANYSTAALCELLPNQAEIVATSSFQTGATGNSLHLNASDPALNMHMCNLLPQPILETAGQTVSVQFDIWVPASAPAGGSVYIGGDHGGGGFSNASDRGPQLSWQTDGNIAFAAYDPVTGGVVNTPVVNNYPRGVWQRVRADIRLDLDTYNLFWAALPGSLSQVGTNLAFRAPTPLNMIDRFSLAHFGATYPTIESYIDNVEIAVGGPGTCYPNCDNSTTAPILNVGDFTCFLQRFAAQDPYANCDNSTVPPVLNVGDFTCFLQRFAAGCS